MALGRKRVKGGHYPTINLPSLYFKNLAYDSSLSKNFSNQPAKELITYQYAKCIHQTPIAKCWWIHLPIKQCALLDK